MSGMIFRLYWVAPVPNDTGSECLGFGVQANSVNPDGSAGDLLPTHAEALALANGWKAQFGGAVVDRTSDLWNPEWGPLP